MFINIWILGIVQAATDCNLVTEIPPAECESLLKFYNSTNGANWENNEGWNKTNTPCSWDGITCEKNRVVEVALSYFNNLIGQIPNFSALSNLQKLDLSYDKLTGTIPDFNLPNLEELSLSYDQLTGTIPNFNLPSLEWLSLSHSQLTGTIPNFNLPNLKRLALNSNKLTGTIPSFTLSNLNALSLKSNQLTGLIPTSSDTIIKLYTIDLRNNPLCKQKDFDYSAWSFPFNTLSGVGVVVESFVDYSKGWQRQLDTFPICGTTTDNASLTFIDFKRYYQVGDIIEAKLEVDFTVTDKVDLWVAVKTPENVFFYITSSKALSSNPQFFKDGLNTMKDRFYVISDFTVPTGMEGTYTFYAALIEAGKNPWQDGMEVIQYIQQISVFLSDK